ncbi:MAG: hypothetical protein GEU86_21665 [Actinophytocola sp.]|nr:hypothetical protein [Actinophytocola sp.]
MAAISARYRDARASVRRWELPAHEGWVARRRAWAQSRGAINSRVVASTRPVRDDLEEEQVDSTAPRGSDVDAAATVEVRGPSPVNGVLRVPGDKSISHRALLLSGLSDGDTLIEGLSRGEDVCCTRQALAALGWRLPMARMVRPGSPR